MPDTSLDDLFDDTLALPPKASPPATSPRNAAPMVPPVSPTSASLIAGAEKLNGVQPELLQHFNNLQDQFAQAGITPIIKSGFRTAQQQNYLHTHGYPTMGNDGYNKISPHQDGRALDIGFAPAQKAKGRQILTQYARDNGLVSPSGEPWHIAIPRRGGNIAPATPPAPLDDLFDDAPTAAPAAPPPVAATPAQRAARTAAPQALDDLFDSPVSSKQLNDVATPQPLDFKAATVPQADSFIARSAQSSAALSAPQDDPTKVRARRDLFASMHRWARRSRRIKSTMPRFILMALNMLTWARAIEMRQAATLTR